jgi:hypothetical protein
VGDQTISFLIEDLTNDPFIIEDLEKRKGDTSPSLRFQPIQWAYKGDITCKIISQGAIGISQNTANTHISVNIQKDDTPEDDRTKMITDCE